MRIILIGCKREGINGLGAQNAIFGHAVYNQHFSAFIWRPFHACNFFGDGDSSLTVTCNAMACGKKRNACAVWKRKAKTDFIINLECGFHIGWVVVRAVIGCMWIDYSTRVVPSTE